MPPSADYQSTLYVDSSDVSKLMLTAKWLKFGICNTCEIGVF